jgi:hypothetical protein
MIFTSSDVWSLSQSLHRWEIGEYVSEAFVILACAGEMVADLGEHWLGERRRRRVERLSTMLLVAALSMSLICLVRTNELSGVVIGSLGDKAEEADKKAKLAISDSSTALAQGKDALFRAGSAEASLSKAEKEAKSAQAASSNALAIAGHARKEADSFEADIKSAKKQAAGAESHLADAMKRADALTVQLNRLTTPRSLPQSPEVVSPLTLFKGTEYMFTGVCGDTECIQLLRDIEKALQLAGWRRIKAPHTFPGLVLWGSREGDDGVGFDLEPGVKVSVESTMELSELEKLPLTSLPQHIQAAVALNLTLASNVSPAENTGRKVDVEKTGSSAVVRVSVGRKPLP